MAISITVRDATKRRVYVSSTSKGTHWKFVKHLRKNWPWVLAIGLLPTLSLLEHTVGLHLPQGLYWLIAMAFLYFLFFKTWKDEYEKRVNVMRLCVLRWIRQSTSQGGVSTASFPQEMLVEHLGCTEEDVVEVLEILETEGILSKGKGGLWSWENPTLVRHGLV